MNKRSAVMMAAGLVAVLALGGVAFSLGLTGPTASVASTRTKLAHVKPIVRTHTKTIVVHKQAPAPAPVVVQVPAQRSAPAYANGGYGDDGYGDDGYGDDGYGDDHGGFESGGGDD